MPNVNSTQINVSLLLNSTDLNKKYIREIEVLLSETNAEITAILVDETTENANSRMAEYDGINISYLPEFFSLAIDEWPRILIWAEAYATSIITKRETPYERLQELQSSISISTIDELSEKEYTYFKPNQVGEKAYEIPDSIVDEITTKSEVVILLGFNKILRGDILHKPKYGVLSLHRSDIRKYRGRPGCFWQFMNDEDEIGLTLQQLTEELDGGHLIHCRHANIEDARTWFEVKYRVDQLYGPMLTEGIKKISNPDYQPEVLSDDELGKLTFESEGYKLSNVMRMVFKNMGGRISAIIPG